MCAISLSAAVAPSTDNGVLLRRKFKNGAVEKYKMQMQMAMKMPGAPSSKPMNMTMSGDMSFTYDKVSGTSAEVTARTSKLSVKMVPDMGMAAANKMPPETSTKMAIDSRGRISAMTLDKATAAGPAGATISSLTSGGFGSLLPEKRVRPGDTWVVPMPAQLAMFGAHNAGLKQKFLGEKTVSGVRVYDILEEAHIDINGLKMPGMAQGNAQAQSALSKTRGHLDISGHLYLKKSDCSFQLMNMSTKTKMTFPNPAGSSATKSSAPFTMDQTMEMTLTRTN